MSTFAFIHGAGDVGWYWHLVEAELRAHGHVTVAPDLPVEDDQAGLGDYAGGVVYAIGGRWDAMVVAQSFGGYVAPLVAERVNARLIVLVAGMVPAPHESAEQMFATTAWQPIALEDNSTRAVFYHDVPSDLADEALRRGGRRQSEIPGKQRWPLDRWPAVPTRAIICRQDRLFPAAWLRRVVSGSALLPTRSTVATARRSASLTSSRAGWRATWPRRTRRTDRRRLPQRPETPGISRRWMSRACEWLCFSSTTGARHQSLFQSTAQGIISLIADRESDFSQEMFVAPISRYSIIFGKILGESGVAFVQGVPILCLACWLA